jgi:hypothetical protein
MEKININYIKGDTFSQGFTLCNCQFEIDKIYFTVKEKTSDKNYVLQKRLGEGIEPDPETEHRYILNIDADDTNKKDLQWIKFEVYVGDEQQAELTEAFYEDDLNRFNELTSKLFKV